MKASSVAGQWRWIRRLYAWAGFEILGARDGDKLGQRFALSGVTQQELTKMVEISRNWIALALSEFERLGLISKSRGHIVIGNVRRIDSYIADAHNH